MYVTIVSVGPCRVLNVHLVSEEANGAEYIMLVDNGRELVVWRVHEMWDDGPRTATTNPPKYHAFNGSYFNYDHKVRALRAFMSRAGLYQAIIGQETGV